MKADEVITGIVVTYNSFELIKRAYESIRLHHPKMKIIIVDGSDKKDFCYLYVSSLESENTSVFHLNYNIGHGRGINLGIFHATTPYVLIFDSDIEMLKSPVQSMLDMMEDDTYGVGYIERTDLGGHDFGARPEHMKHGSMIYLHPYFCLLQLKEYKKYSPFIHHGAPAVNTCLDIHNKGLSHKVIKEFPGLGHSSGRGFSWIGKPREYITHDIAGTRTLRKSKGLSEIEGVWEKTIGKGMITCLTPTGDRPEAFELTRRWIISQTLQPNQWLVIDDGFNPLPEHLKQGLDYVRREPSKGEGHTLTSNLKAALPHIKGDKILIIEDDDWYGPDYIKTMSNYLDKFDLVGEGHARYYNLPSLKYRRLMNQISVSLCQTGFNKPFLPTFEKSLPGDPYVDLRIWAAANNYKHIFIDAEDKLQLHCSMKGLKGRRGIGTGHYPDHYYRIDRGLKNLVRWVGVENAKIYLEHIGLSFEDAVRITASQKQLPKMSWRDKVRNAQDCLMDKQTNAVSV